MSTASSFVPKNAVASRLFFQYDLRACCNGCSGLFDRVKVFNFIEAPSCAFSVSCKMFHEHVAHQQYLQLLYTVPQCRVLDSELEALGKANLSQERSYDSFAERGFADASCNSRNGELTPVRCMEGG